MWPSRFENYITTYYARVDAGKDSTDIISGNYLSQMASP